jgi:hypothetical protein
MPENKHLKGRAKEVAARRVLTRQREEGHRKGE